MEPSRPAATPLKTGTGTTVAGGGEPPYDGNMEHRITNLQARWDTIFPTLATKADLADGLQQNAMAISALRGEMQQSFGEVRIEIQQVRTDMQKLSSDIKTWTLATVLTIIGAMLAALIAISQAYKATPPALIAIISPAK
jgi:hypothetical protein